MGKGKDKKALVISIVAAVIIILALAGFIGYSRLFGSSTTSAFLYIDEGGVEVNKGSGWSPALDEMQLGINDAVRTLDNGRASLVFFESDIMELEPNTEVALKDIAPESVALEQKSGSTWNRVSKLTGSRSYSVETPTSVATVRGTGFGVNFWSGGVNIPVEEGLVDCSSKEVQSKQSIGEYEECIIDIGKGALKGKITKENLILIKKKLQKDVYNLQRIRWREAMKHRGEILKAKQKYGLTDDQITAYLDAVDHGKKNLDEIEAKVPFKSSSLSKIRKLTEKIVELNKRIDLINQKIASY